PSGTDDAIGIITLQLNCIGARFFMDLNAIAYSDKAEDIIARNRMAALCQAVIKLLFITAKNQLVIIGGDFFAVNGLRLIGLSDFLFEKRHQGIISRSGIFF